MASDTPAPVDHAAPNVSGQAVRKLAGIIAWARTGKPVYLADHDCDELELLLRAHPAGGVSEDVVERVARAICESAEADQYDDLGERSVVKALYRQQAKDALRAAGIGAGVVSEETIERCARLLDPWIWRELAEHEDTPENRAAMECVKSISRDRMRRALQASGAGTGMDDKPLLNRVYNTVSEDQIFALILNLGDPLATLERLNARYDNWVSANNECGAQRNA